MPSGVAGKSNRGPLFEFESEPESAASKIDPDVPIGPKLLAINLLCQPTNLYQARTATVPGWLKMANPHPIQRLAEDRPFHQKDAIKSGLKGAVVGGGAGLFASAVQNSLAKHHVGVWGVFTRTGGTITTFALLTRIATAALTTVYSFSKDAAANLREKDDTFNTTIASFLGGATLGLRYGAAGRMPRILGLGAAFAVIMTAFDYTGSSLVGKRTDVSGMDEYDRKEYLRKNRRRPIEETIADIGEGRGIEPPGYEERRRERLKEKYGVEIKPVSALVD
ncbi:hypothetical protein RRF57_001404 [Xylaria bambusicola]|uniref:NADH-ubiquinone oxidoreductase 213 kDa subunit n=1 Tax=Xylaria bambusicola TaxID=326684 RepID=A0AAN7Z3G7_9PEZI